MEPATRLLLLGACFLVLPLMSAQDGSDPIANNRPDAASPVMRVKVHGVWEPVYQVGPGVTPPRKVDAPPPEFSDEARRKGITGTVGLAMTVTSEGKVTQIRVTKSLGYGLDEKAIEAARHWKFKPGMKDGSPVSVQVAVESTLYQ